MSCFVVCRSVAREVWGCRQSVMVDQCHSHRIAVQTDGGKCFTSLDGGSTMKKGNKATSKHDL